MQFGLVLHNVWAMKILFVLSDLFFNEPLGVMGLAATGKQGGHQVRLLSLKKHDLAKNLKTFHPDLVAYSAMTPEMKLFKKADAVVRAWIKAGNPGCLRVMGGAHATYFPEVLGQMELDAVCVGEGDRALGAIIRAVENKLPIRGIPNVAGKTEAVSSIKKELITNLDELPFVDRESFYQAAPVFKHIGLRSIITSRGCPHRCAYCHNHVFNKMFAGCGKTVRRKSAGYIMAELSHVIRAHPPCRLIRFADDSFASTVDGWLEDFLERYAAQISLPFYCLMRPDAMTADMARLLSSHGCVAVGMSIETGDAARRKNLLHRDLPDEVIVSAFENARRYNIKTKANTILALPGSRLEDDFYSLAFAKSLKASVPTFSIFAPLPGTGLAEYAVQQGYLQEPYVPNDFMEQTILGGYSQKEKNAQLNLAFLGPLLCALPGFLEPLVPALARVRPNAVFKLAGSAFLVAKLGLSAFPGVAPKNPLAVARLFAESLKSINPKKKRGERGISPEG